MLSEAQEPVRGGECLVSASLILFKFVSTEMANQEIDGCRRAQPPASRLSLVTQGVTMRARVPSLSDRDVDMAEFVFLKKLVMEPFLSHSVRFDEPLLSQGSCVAFCR